MKPLGFHCMKLCFVFLHTFHGEERKPVAFRDLGLVAGDRDIVWSSDPASVEGNKFRSPLSFILKSELGQKFAHVTRIGCERSLQVMCRLATRGAKCFQIDFKY